VNVPVIAMATAAGITLHAALTHGSVGLGRRPRDAVRIAFAIEALSVAAGSLALVAMYSATTPETHVAVTKWVFFPAEVVWVASTVWMVAFYADVRPLRWLVALSAGFGAVLLVNAMLPFGLMHGELDGIRSAALGGAHLTVTSAPSPHPLDVVTEALVVGAFVFMFIAVWRVYRRGEQKKAILVGLAVVLFTLATAVDKLADYGVVSSLYLTQLSFVVVVLAVGTGLRRDSLRAEARLKTDRAFLRSLVDERVSELGEANERLELEARERLATEGSLRRRVAELDGLQRISRTLAERGDMAAALDAAALEIAALLEARYARIDLPDGEAACAGRSEEDCEPATIGQAESDAEVGWSDLARAIDLREPAVFDGPEWAGLSTATRAHVVPEGIDHLLAVPLAARGSLFGVLSVGRDTGAAFSPGEMRLAATVAASLAAAVENERLHEKQTRQAAEDERQRLARDLHDAVTQTIYSAALIAEALPVVWERAPSEALVNLGRLRRLVRAALAEMRTLLFELRPAALLDAPLETSLSHLVDSLAGKIQAPIDLRADAVVLSPEVKIVLYRVTQEAFSNIAKHARATEVGVLVDADDQGRVTLQVRDDGRGFDPREIGSAGMGLHIMRERVDGIGGALAIDSAPDRGTTITVVCPRPAERLSTREEDRELSTAH